MTHDEKLELMQRRIDQLANEVAMHADREAVRTLQFKYGYYMDKCLFSEIVELFAEDAVIYFLNGIYRGKRGARRMYGGASGLSGPAYGMLFEHIIAQDIVDVAPDRKTARGRFRCFMQGGVHESKKDAPPRIPAQFLEAGIYENEYVKEDGVWKISKLHGPFTMYSGWDGGWIKNATPNTRPDSFGEPPDLPPTVVYLTYPSYYIVPFHYPNPVTGKPFKPLIQEAGAYASPTQVSLDNPKGSPR